MRIALIGRSTLYTIPGGDTVQITETARQLNQQGVDARVCLSHSRIKENEFDLFHFFNIIRPADILPHLQRIKKPYVVSPVYIDYSEYDRQHRKGLSGLLLKPFSAARTEYIKTLGRAVKGNDRLPGWEYLFKGQQKSIRKILSGAACILPNSSMELEQIRQLGIHQTACIIPNGIDKTLFGNPGRIEKDNDLILCAARIEGIKNQLNLIRALNNCGKQVVLAGSAAPNQQSYYQQCKKEAAGNIVFAGRLTQTALANYYARARVHVLPSWFETCGLSSLEAAAMGCNIVITAKGYTRDYFGDEAFYCDPGKPASIREAVMQAATTATPMQLADSIKTNYTWERAAAMTLSAYQTVLHS